MIGALSSGTQVDGAYVVVLESAKQFCTIYDVGFNKVVSSDEQMAGEYSEGKVGLFRTDTFYNVRSRQNRPSSEYDVFGLVGLVDMV